MPTDGSLYQIVICYTSWKILAGLYADYLNGGMQDVLCKRNHCQLLRWLGEPISLELSSEGIHYLSGAYVVQNCNMVFLDSWIHYVGVLESMIHLPELNMEQNCVG